MKYLSVLILLCIVAPAWADDFVCGDATQMQRYVESVDPSRVTDPTCFQIPEDQTPAQRDLVSTVPRKYLKVVGGLAVQKDQAEKDQIDQAQAAQDQAQANYNAEITTQDLCSTDSLTGINTRLKQVRDATQVAIDAATNVATLKTALTKMAEDYMQVIQKNWRCMLSHTKVR